MPRPEGWCCRIWDAEKKLMCGHWNRTPNRLPAKTHSCAACGGPRLPRHKVLRSTATGEIHITGPDSWYLVPCRDGPECSNRRCQFQHAQTTWVHVMSARTESDAQDARNFIAGTSADKADVVMREGDDDEDSSRTESANP